jgi:hypothetical protein
MTEDVVGGENDVILQQSSKSLVSGRTVVGCPSDLARLDVAIVDHAGPEVSANSSVT